MLPSRLTPALADMDLHNKPSAIKASHSSQTLPTPPQTKHRQRRLRLLKDILEDVPEGVDEELSDDDRPHKKRRVANEGFHTPKKTGIELPSFLDLNKAMAIASPPTTPTKSLIPTSSFSFQTPKRPTRAKSVENNPFIDSDDEDENPFLSVVPIVNARETRDDVVQLPMEERPSTTYVLSVFYPQFSLVSH